VVPKDTKVLIAELKGVGRDYPLSIEKLCPALSYYVVSDWREGCERCKQILRYGGMGHTMSIHSTNEDVILEFGLKKPAFRIVVNTPTTHGSIGLTTGLDPAMTLGCGGYGGNITSDNISPRHLLNIKRLAYELRPASTGRSSAAELHARGASSSRLPQAPGAAESVEIGTGSVQENVAAYLAARGALPPQAPVSSLPAPDGESGKPVAFVCEEDVRLAIKHGRPIVIGERTIVTPAARDLGEARRIFVQAGWPGA
jgi:acetaldehyde dehydrogenase (acetylating)